MAIHRRNLRGQFSKHGQQIWRDGKLLSGRRRDTALRILRGESKPRKPKPKVDDGEPADVSHAVPVKFKSPFRRFLQNLDTGNPNRIATVYVIVSRTLAKYKTSQNKDGVRTFPITLGDMRLGDARKLTLEQLQQRGVKANDQVHAIVQLKGAAATRTPASGDKGRSAIWTRLRKTFVPAARKTFKATRGKVERKGGRK